MMTWERISEERLTAASARMRYLRASAFVKAVADRLAVLQEGRSFDFAPPVHSASTTARPGGQKGRGI